MSLTFEQRLRARGLIATPEPPPPVTDTFVIRGDAAVSRYLTAAVNGEASRLAATTQGSRNHTLNAAAYSLGGLVAGAGLDEQVVIAALTDAATACGLTAHEIPQTLRSGLDAGKKKPRGVPDPTVDYRPAPVFELVSDDPEARDAAVTAYVHEHLPRLDWHALWEQEDDEEWIVEPLLPARRLIALYSAPKVGKSLLMLELAVAIACGTPVLGATVDRPRRVLYVDFENDPRADVRARLQAMNVGPDDLGNLCYLSFPTLAALDSEKGGAELMAAVTTYDCDVVVIDTVSRSVSGEENENDTWLAFYRHTGLKLKQNGIALVRLDHSGKDETKGQRGGSAKSGDIDAVWRLSKVTDDTFRLDCEAHRMPVHETAIVLHRETTPTLHHRVDPMGRSAAYDAKVTALIEALDAAEVAIDAPRTVVREAIKARGLKARDEVLSEVLRRRKRAEASTGWEL